MYADYQAALIRHTERLERADRQRRARRWVADARAHRWRNHRTR